MHPHARAEREPLSGTIRIGVIPTVGPYLLPRVLPDLRRAFGQLKLYLVEDLTVSLIDDLHQGKLDVVLLALPCDCGAVEMLKDDVRPQDGPTAANGADGGDVWRRRRQWSRPRRRSRRAAPKDRAG